MLSKTHQLITLVKEFFLAGHREERGDVPGWVMITLMTAVLVAAILALALPAFSNLFQQAIDQVAR